MCKPKALLQNIPLLLIELQLDCTINNIKIIRDLCILIAFHENMPYCYICRAGLRNESFDPDCIFAEMGYFMADRAASFFKHNHQQFVSIKPFGCVFCSCINSTLRSISRSPSFFLIDPRIFGLLRSNYSSPFCPARMASMAS